MFTGFRGRIISPEIQTRDTEEKRAARYAGFRISIRMLAILLVVVEVILVGPTLALWAALAGIIYGIDRVRIVLDTRDPCDVVIRVKPDLRRNPRFLGLAFIAIASEALILSDLWFPIWFSGSDGLLWWHTATRSGAVLPGLGSFAYWARMIMLAGIPIGFWDPLRILDWVYRVESVWTQYRNTVFAQASVDTVQTPMGTITSTKGGPPKPEAPVLGTFRLTSSAPVPAGSNGGSGQVKTIDPAGGVIDLE